MKVVLIYRKYSPEAFSIEELFRTIAAEMQNQVEVIQYTASSRYKVFIDAWKLRKLKADIYHITGDINYMACLLPRKKTILTLHDIVHFSTTLKGLKYTIYKYLWLIFPIQWSTKVTSISSATVDSLKQTLSIDKPITVVNNCYNPIFKPVYTEFNKACPTILQIGTLPHKNLPRLITAIADLHCRFITIGRLDAETLELLKRYKINYENYIGLTLDEVYQHYINCDIVSFISLQEGFGVPIIEAQAVGRVVITSNYPPMSNVAGNKACLVNPYSIDEIRDSIIKIINDENYRNSLINNGLENAKNYSAKTISQKYLDLYKEIYQIRS